eukprot:scaffold16770_cov113-Cylindrotheca_fusiformis.AAC.1
MVLRLMKSSLRRSSITRSHCIFTQSTISRNLSNHNKPLVTVGILRETYDKWERRSPLTPDHVARLLRDHDNLQVIVQPSSQRIFPNDQYEAAGATIQESLQDATVILGVKRPKSLDHHGTIPERSTCLFFSHVLKGQPENMDLLQQCLSKRIQLMDYECIIDPESKKRIVAFGKYAGMAAMIDSLPVLGRRLLGKFHTTTPFLSCPPAIYHSRLDDAKKSVDELGRKIAVDGLPFNLPPIVVCVTGGRGNVSTGVHEILDLIPHEVVQVRDLPSLAPARHHIHVVAPEYEDLYHPIIKSSGHDDDAEFFDRDDFLKHPLDYSCTFSDRIAPYIQVLMNGIYWDDRFPRLLTRDDMQRMHEMNQDRLLLISDISCDINGSIEFLDRPTTIDNPCYQYDPILRQESSDLDCGITVMGVDILPSELPIESSCHFGDAVKPVLDELVVSASNERGTVDASHLSSQLLTPKFVPQENAMITNKEGAFSFKFKYLNAIMKRTTRQQQPSSSRSITLWIEGHLFDTGLINQILDVLDANHCGFRFKECHVEHRSDDIQVKSRAILLITGGETTDFDKVESKIATLVKAIERAKASFRRIDETLPNDGPPAYTTDPIITERVLLLGSGRVSKSVVEYLGRSKNRTIVVASNDEAEAKRVAASANNKDRAAEHVGLDAQADPHRLNKLVDQSDIVISLLPAPMHPQIAELCIENGTDLVTASYESDEMRKLGKRARESGVKILQECGLDPGLDHCSAKKIIDDIQGRGGKVVIFSSVCGGLPAPEVVAEDNPLKYKFSWSPKGVITASQAPARYRWEGKNLEIPGNQLLQQAAPFVDAWPDLHLECLPNRDSLLYESVYGIGGGDGDDGGCRTMFRGTLRYRGFSSLMAAFQNMGLFDDDNDSPLSSLIDGQTTTTWRDVLDQLAGRSARGRFDDLPSFIQACTENDMEKSARVMECLDWLGMTSSSSSSDAVPLDSTTNRMHPSVMELFCQRLEEKLLYGDDERDMILMHHTIGAEFEDGSIEEHHSSLQAFGGDNNTMSAMCKTVGFTAAVATELILSGDLDELNGGLYLPTERQIYMPILESLEQEGIVFEERCKVQHLPPSRQVVF